MSHSDLAPAVFATHLVACAKSSIHPIISLMNGSIICWACSSLLEKFAHSSDSGLSRDAWS